MKKMTERERFEEHYKTSRDYKFYVKHEMTEKQIFEFDHTKYKVGCVNDAWIVWQASKCDAVPDGYVIVPKEPTCEMVEAGMGDFDFPLDNGRFSNHDLIFAYKAMIEAQEQENV